MQETNLLVVLAEDNPGDVFLVRRALDSHHLAHELLVAQDGEEALNVVERAETGEITIGILLIDLNLPKHDGGEILARVRSCEQTADLPVILLTSSDSPYDRERILGLGANRYFRKPTDLYSFMQLGRIVREVLSETGRAPEPS
jgi:CheY-like chemotaxis protein